MKRNKQNFSDYYKDEEVVNTYDEIRLKTKYRRDKRQKEMNIFMELINPQESDKILELGCSSGFMTQFLKGNITAIDTSENMLKVAGKKNPKAKFICMDMFDINRRFRGFNKVTSKRVLTHLTNEELEDL
jgi:ubiquinone/menaquinone biosynthesis C-methylase UbiE